MLIGHSMGGLVALLAALDGVPADALVLYEPIVLDCLDMNDPVDSAARAWDAERVDKLRDGVAGGDPEAGVKAFIEAFNEVSWSDLPATLRADLVSKAAVLAAETRAAPLVELDRSKLAALLDAGPHSARRALAAGHAPHDAASRGGHPACRSSHSCLASATWGRPCRPPPSPPRSSHSLKSLD